MLAQHITLILNSTLLQMFSEQEVVHYVQEGTFKIAKVSKGRVLHLEGELCNRLELVLAGKLVVERISDSGDLMTVADFTANDVLGGGLIFSKQPYYPMTVRAAETSTLVQIPKDALFGLLSTKPGFLKVFLELTSDRTSVLTERIKYHLNKPLRERIVNFLDNQSRLQNSRRISLPTSKTSLAQKLGVQRTSLSRELKKMQDEGLISFTHNSITLQY